MKIQFQKADAVYVEIEKLRKKIAVLTCVDTNFIEIVCDILLSMSELTNDLTHKLKKVLDMARYKIAQKNLDAYSVLGKLLIEYYILIQDFNFDSKLRTHNPEEYRNYKLCDMGRKLALFRGVLFEAIVEELVRDRFIKQDFSTGCKILINGQLVVVQYGNGKKKQTFDIAGWHHDKQYGEFYECKIQPDKFKIENYELMLKLENKLICNNVKSYKLAAVSANSNSFFENQIRLLENGTDNKIQNFTTYGKDTLSEIRAIELPISA